MKKKLSPGTCAAKFAALAIAVMLQIAVFAQNPVLKVFEDWNTQSGTQNMFQRSRVISASSGGAIYYYVAGATLNSSGNYDMLVQKLNSSGVLLWQQQYDGAGHGNDVAADVQVRASTGDVYVTGTCYVSSADSNDAVTIMYNSSGTQQWVSTYNGSGSANDGTVKVYVDASNGDVYATGSTYSGSTNMYDALILKYNNSGSQQWVTTWDNVNLEDGGYVINTSLGNIVVGAGTQTAATTYKMAVLTITPSTGAITGTRITGGTGFGIDHLNDITKDASGNIYITGGVYDSGTGYDIKTMKLNSNLVVQWGVTWNGADSLDDEATGMYLDSLNNVIVTGYTKTASNGKDYVTVKYNNSGSQQWAETFNDTANANDSATAIVVHGTDYIYVTGYAYNGTSNDYYTIRYDGSGNQKWGIGFNAVQNGNDVATAIALDTAYNVIVSGQNQINSSTRIYTSVKYIERDVTYPQDTATASSSYVFTDNKGQLHNTDGNAIPQIKFYTLHSRPKIYFADTSVSYVFVKPDTTSSGNDSLTRVDMVFNGANSDLKIRSTDARGEVNNFYPRSNDRFERVLDYDKLVSFSVWNGVDIMFGSNGEGLKYYFLCHPAGGGGTAGSIDLKYNGADSVKVDANGRLVIYTALGNIVQPKAAAWELDGSGNFSSLGWRPAYNIVGTNEIQFDSLGSYNVAHTLVIAVDWGDPIIQSNNNLEWSTYYGGDWREEVKKVRVRQSDGTTYYTGMTYSSYFPVSSSAMQSTNVGGEEAFAVKFDSTGHWGYSTYYGVILVQPPVHSYIWGNSGAVDSQGNFCFGGYVSRDTIQHIQFANPPLAGAYLDTTMGGNSDAFLAELTPNGGTVRWATYYGGSGTAEEIRDMRFDSHDNLYVVMSGDTSVPLMNESGAFFDSLDHGGVILKFDSTLALNWATRFGTPGGSLSAIAIDPSDNVYVTGIAKDSLPLVDPGGAYMDSTLGGTQDACIAKFSASNNSLLWSTYIGGSGTESGIGIIASATATYVSGSTGSTDFPFYYQGAMYIDSTLGGSSDIFIARFKPTGQREWATYYGGSSADGGDDIETDASNNVYLIGSTSGNFPTYSAPYCYYSSTYGGNPTDAVIVSFDWLNKLSWATYFGGASYDAEFGIAAFSNQHLYVCGYTGTSSTVNPPWPTQDLGGGAYFQSNLYPGALNNGCISRFSLSPLINLGVNDPQAFPHSYAGNLMVFPNPGSGEFQVLVSSTAKNKKIEVYNSLGQLLQNVKLDDNLTSQSIFLNLSEVATGIYFIILKDDCGLTSKKIIKQ